MDRMAILHALKVCSAAEPIEAKKKALCALLVIPWTYSLASNVGGARASGPGPPAAAVAAGVRYRRGPCREVTVTHLLRLARLALLMLSALALALGPASEAYAAPDGAAFEAPTKQKKKGKKKKKKKKAKKKGKKKVGNIQMTGLKSIDGFFGDARSIDRRLDAAQKARRDGRTSIATAMGLPKSASLGDAIAELDRKTKGKLSIVMNGAVPEITPAGMMPSDVRAGLRPERQETRLRGWDGGEERLP